MSVHSLASINDESYKGYEITKEGEVVEFYDHRDDVSPPPSLPASRAMSGSKPLLSQHASSAVGGNSHVSDGRFVKVRITKKGCCDSCIGCFETIGRLPYASAFCLFLIWVGVGLFCGCGMALMDETQRLYDQFGPKVGNPYTDPRPQYLYLGPDQAGHYELRNPDDLGNRVPEAFESLRYSFYAIIPFMILYSLILLTDGHRSTYELRHKEPGCKSRSAGICCSLSLLFISYWLLLFWIFFLCFTTLAVYYYRIVNLRCYDLDDRGYESGTQKSICVDLVQFGIIMFKDQTDPDRGKICGPGDSSRSSVGDLRGYCDNYYSAYRYAMLAFAGCFLLVIGMMHSIMILSSNYSSLKIKFMQPRHRKAVIEVNGSTIPPSPANTRRTNFSGYSAPRTEPTVVIGTSGGDVRPRRPSRDVELEELRPRRGSRDLDYLDDDSRSGYPPSNYTRNLEKNSHVGVDYYYRRY